MRLENRNKPMRVAVILGLGFALLANLAVWRAPQTAAASSVRPAVAPSGPFKIKFDYSKVDGALFNDIVKEQIEAGARILESFISTEAEFTITVVNGKAAGALATGAPREWVENTEERSIAKSGGIEFGTQFIAEARDGKSSISALTMHEILHCMGFVPSAKATAKYIKDGKYSGVNLLKMNNNKPVSFDGAHFARGTQDPHGIAPRATDGGGELLSVLDLAVLADLGYDIPEVSEAKSAPHISFTFPIGYYNLATADDGGKPWHEVIGLSGNDRLTAHHKEFRYKLVGGGGDDILIGGPNDDSLDGDNARTLTRDPRSGIPEPGAPGKDTFVIGKGGGKDTIEGFETGKDEIWLSPALGITEEQIEKALETFPQEIRKPFTTADGRSMVMIETINLIKVGTFEIIVNPASDKPADKPKASDFHIRDWKP